MHAPRRALALLLPLFLLGACAHLRAQEEAADPFKSLKVAGAPPAGGTVSGRVMYADTNGPARFSKVLLKSAAASTGDADVFSTLASDEDDAPKSKSSKAKHKRTPEEEARLKAASKAMAALSDLMVSATVGADGVYLFTNVKPGTYYVHAMAPGYIDPLAVFSADDLESADPAMRKRIAALVPVVTVAGTGEAHADLRLDRGASLSGRVLYDDGTPAVGWTVRTVYPAASSAPATPSFDASGMDPSDFNLTHITEVSVTDDRGHFRIPGLPTGSYMLQAELAVRPLGTSSFNAIAGTGAMSAVRGLKLRVYSGNALTQTAAKTIDVRAGDDRTGYDITMPLSTLHAVVGMVRAKNDGHPVNSGVVELTGQDAQGKDDPTLHLTASIGADGAFRFDYVPGATTYTIKVQKAADVTTTSTMKMLGSTIADQKTNRSFGPVSSTVIVGDSDATGIKLEVPDAPAN